MYSRKISIGSWPIRNARRFATPLTAPDGEQVGRAALERLVHLARRHDLVGQLLGRELGAGQDRLARAAVADEARQPQVRGARDDPLVARRQRAAAALLGHDVVDGQQQLAARRRSRTSRPRRSTASRPAGR